MLAGQGEGIPEIDDDEAQERELVSEDEEMRVPWDGSVAIRVGSHANSQDRVHEGEEHEIGLRAEAKEGQAPEEDETTH